MLDRKEAQTRSSVTVHRVPAPAIFLLAGVSQYLGAALAVVLFRAADPAAVAWLRLLGAALVLLAWRRPGRSAWRGRRLLRAGVFGVVTGLMNVAFYLAISRLPLGTAVAVEFCGPVAVAALSSRTRRDWTALGLAALGVLLIAEVHWAASAPGVLWACAAAAAWAGYIVLAKRVAQAGSGAEALDDLATGFAIGVLLLAPLAPRSAEVWSRPHLPLIGVGVGVLSSVLPYGLDQLVLRRIGRDRFAVLLALLPVTATVVGLVTLGQLPGLAEAAAIIAVVAAVWLRSGEDDAPTGDPGQASGGAPG